MVVKFVPTCPICGKRMRKRTGKHGPFWGCPAFPACRGTRAAHEFLGREDHLDETMAEQDARLEEPFE